MTANEAALRAVLADMVRAFCPYASPAHDPDRNRADIHARALHVLNATQPSPAPRDAYRMGLMKWPT